MRYGTVLLYALGLLIIVALGSGCAASTSNEASMLSTNRTLGAGNSIHDTFSVLELTSSPNATNGVVTTTTLPLQNVRIETGSAIYTTEVQQSKTVIIGVFTVPYTSPTPSPTPSASATPVSGQETASLSVLCPKPSSTSIITRSVASRHAIFCSPSASSTNIVTTTVTWQNTTSNYGVFAYLIDNATGMVFTENFSGISLAAYSVKGYKIINRNTDIQQRRLVFNSSQSDSVAILYRQDGTFICDSLSQNLCQVYNSDYNDYYLLVFNLTANTMTYNISFSSTLVTPTPSSTPEE